MSSRDIWSHGVGRSLQDLLTSCCSTLLLSSDDSQPTYFSSPWMSNFVLFENPFGEWGALFPELAEQTEIRFTEFLSKLSQQRPIRLVVVDNSTSQAFVNNPDIAESPGIESRFAPETYHEKGILAGEFYIEGSMNLTYSGVCLRDEKVVFHPVRGNEEKLHLAFLQFDRLWENLGAQR